MEHAWREQSLWQNRRCKHALLFGVWVTQNTWVHQLQIGLVVVEGIGRDEVWIVLVVIKLGLGRSVAGVGRGLFGVFPVKTRLVLAHVLWHLSSNN